ncbi:putative HNH nuclease domain-containing protein [Seiridium cardinale]
MADPAKYWPGGIPPHVQCHGEPLEDDLAEEVKGWQLFLEPVLTYPKKNKENSVPREPGNEDENFEVSQRRRLVEQWALMDQEERDAYQDRAPDRDDGECWYPDALEGDLSRNLQEYGFCNLVVGQPQGPRDRALWAKMRVLLYRLDGQDGTSFGDVGGGGIEELPPRPPVDGIASQGTVVRPEDLYRWLWVEPARFDHMAMTRQGTVVFHQCETGMFFVDQEALETGRLRLCEIENNGQVVADARVWPVFAYHVSSLIHGLSRSVDEVEEDGFIDNEGFNDVLDMEKPVLELLEAMKAAVKIFPGTHVSAEQWERDIERYAPGYREAEHRGGGLALGYDFGNFRTDAELQQLRRGD